MRFFPWPGPWMGRGAGAAPCMRGTRSGTDAGQARSNWPSLTPATNAAHSSGVKRSTGPLGSFESLRSTSVIANPTSTQAGLTAPEKELLRNAGDGESGLLDSFIEPSFLVCRLHRVGGETKNRPLTWADSWMTNWGATWERTWVAVWAQTWRRPLRGQRVAM